MSLTSAANIYRKLLCGVTLAALAALAASAAAQVAPPPAKKPPRSARAVALIEFHADAHGVAQPRLLPIALLWEGKYYDAGVYQATPVPLALESGTVYEALASGEPKGLFTVRDGVELKGVWYGQGQWAAGVTETKSAAEEGPPRLSRPKPEASGELPEMVPVGKSQPAPEVNDPNRPKLHRGQPVSAATTPPPTEVPPPASASSPPAPAKPVAKAQVIVAVSDEQLQGTRPYIFPWTRDEEERLTQEMKSLAEAEVAKRARGAKPALDQVSVRAFDVNTDNFGEIVLSARATVAQPAPKGKTATATYYVTVVARTTVSGELRRLFGSVTSPALLDSIPRMELVDAVDADGDEHAELLFGLFGASSHRYAIYRVGRDELFELVESGPVPNE